MYVFGTFSVLLTKKLVSYIISTSNFLKNYKKNKMEINYYE